MNIAILYICTGKYSAFWEKFYGSAEQFFLQGHEKHYFVFTDDPRISETTHIHVIYKKPEGFPMDSLMRFQMFLGIGDKLKSFVYIFFLNANTRFVAPVGDEILPGDQNQGLTGVLHAGYVNSSPFWMPFERRKKSKAFVPPSLSHYHYYLGGINGGTTHAYLQLIRECQRNIQSDLDNGIMAFYHDESHINCYFADKNILPLSPSYGYPEGWNLPYEPKILLLNKIKHGGKYFDKLPSTSYLKRGRLFLKRLISGILWYLK